MKRSREEWERLALNTFCPYCHAPPRSPCMLRTPTRLGRLERPHKTRVTAVKKGASR